MTLQDLIYEVGELSCVSPRIQSDVKGFINRAQRQICNRRNFLWMQDIRQYTIPSNSISVPLDADFKQLTTEKSPVTWTDTVNQAARIPVTILSREEAERYNWAFFYPYNAPVAPLVCPPVPWVFIDQIAGVWTLNNSVINQVTNQAMIYNVSGYFYPKPLVLGTDSNALTQHGQLAEALVNCAKATAYFAEKPGHPDGVEAMAIYEKFYQSACYSDARQKIGGQSVHM
jgi:hypothetical protein